MKPIETKPVSSSNLKAVGYDAQTARLKVDFHNNTSYIYSGVPARIVEEMLAAKSVGSYFTTNIRTRYKYEKA